mmetsp:Transcript_35665/g.100961  ORF Transcript_35665/g.100961 Transcript_35665/m.100961 type:complete len:519 (+) Transcript_35665:1607-3163(+)
MDLILPHQTPICHSALMCGESLPQVCQTCWYTMLTLCVMCVYVCLRVCEWQWQEQLTRVAKRMLSESLAAEAEIHGRDGKAVRVNREGTAREPGPSARVEMLMASVKQQKLGASGDLPATPSAISGYAATAGAAQQSFGSRASLKPPPLEDGMPEDSAQRHVHWAQFASRELAEAPVEERGLWDTASGALHGLALGLQGMLRSATPNRPSPSSQFISDVAAEAPPLANSGAREPPSRTLERLSNHGWEAVHQASQEEFKNMANPMFSQSQPFNEPAIGSEPDGLRPHVSNPHSPKGVYECQITGQTIRIDVPDSLPDDCATSYEGITRSMRSVQDGGEPSAKAFHVGVGWAVEGSAGAAGPAPMAVWIGNLMDGVAEAVVIGAHVSSLISSQAQHPEGSDGVASLIPYTLIAGLCLANFPEAMAASMTMYQYGWSKVRVVAMWVSLTTLIAVGSGVGYLLASVMPEVAVIAVEGFAAGAMLVMIASSMIPEAVHLCGPNAAGMWLLCGFTVAYLFELV